MSKLLNFTPDQALAVNTQRMAFNSQQKAISQAWGFSGAGFGAEGMVGNAAPIGKDSWMRIDTEAATIQRDELVVFNRLAAAKTVPVAVADLVSFYPKISSSGSANFSLDGRRKGKGDQALVQYAGTPVPVIDDEASFGWRQMEMLRRGGGMIETESINNSLRVVAESIEDMTINGKSAITVDGNTIYGLRNFPGRNTGTHGLTLASATGAQWLTAMLATLNLLIGDNAYGRVTFFMNYGDWLAISVNEFTAGYPKTILQRLLEIQQIVEFVPSTRIPANEMAGVAGLASGKWGKILSAMPITTRPKIRQNPEDEYVFTAMAMVAPQFVTDYDGRSQICHVTSA